MAFNLLAESAAPLEWDRLQRALRRDDALVECFPIPARVGETDALGISVPGLAANEQGWLDLERVLRTLLDDFRMEITELYTGVRINQANLSKVRGRLLGEPLHQG